MKYIPLIILLTACGASSKKYHPQKPDTAVTAVLFKNATNSVKLDFMYRITRDTVGFVRVDDITQKMQQKRDSFYYAQIIDTLKDAKGKIILDSLKRPRLDYKYGLVNRSVILKDLGSVNEYIK